MYVHKFLDPVKKIFLEFLLTYCELSTKINFNIRLKNAIVHSKLDFLKSYCEVVHEQSQLKTRNMTFQKPISISL